ncbi:predicted protein [Plenodomus lingam JN3]|uniref:Predicted protein n=1 Tax=Leptosphaeria maculans (strain JN3 / isolate v23.1.3 / race Av1-4-5-6-7-8) TaxID=985895 RepID=E4ZQR0_LEPMJ|nr:predicted protein [Plenodomus lingam JN3]CBX94065.1 predicted protein [Plenodomus lingam JN3]
MCNISPRSSGKLKHLVKSMPKQDDEWLILFHEKIKTVFEAGSSITIPKPPAINEIFNSYFQNRITRDFDENQLAPHPFQEEHSIHAKLTHRIDMVKCFDYLHV